VIQYRILKKQRKLQEPYKGKKELINREYAVINSMNHRISSRYTYYCNNNKYKHQGSQQSSHNGHYTHTSESANVKIQNAYFVKYHHIYHQL